MPDQVVQVPARHDRKRKADTSTGIIFVILDHMWSLTLYTGSPPKRRTKAKKEPRSKATSVYPKFLEAISH